MAVEILALAWVAVLLVAQPLVAFRGRSRVAGSHAPRLKLYLGSAIGIAVIGLVCLLLDWLTGASAARAVLAGLPAPRLAGWTLGTMAACAAFWAATQYARKIWRAPPGPAYLHLLPRSGSEKAAFAGLSVLAGVAEEFAFRGFCLFQIHDLTGSWAVAAVLTTLGFGLGHAYQGAVSTLRTTVAGVVLIVPVLVTGSLLPSMLGHALLDFMTGLWARPLLGRWGLLEAPGKGQGAA